MPGDSQMANGTQKAFPGETRNRLLEEGWKASWMPEGLYEDCLLSSTDPVFANQCL